MKKSDAIPSAVAFAIMFALTLTSVSLRAQTATSDIPHVISYQGVLQTATGQTVDGPRKIRTTLYSDAAGTQPVWQDEFTPTVHGGTFDLALGSQKALPSVSGTVWLGVQVGDDPEMRPLQQLYSAPYAMTVANGAITADKMGTDYVSSISINGERVTTQGSALNLVAGDGISLSYDPYSSTVAMRSVASAPEKGAKSQSQNQDLDMNGHNIINAPTYMAGIAGTTAGAVRLYTSTNANYATITSAAQGANRTYTIPDAGGDATFVMQTGAQTISGLKTFSAGATMGSSVNMGNNRIMNVASPTTTTDAATKAYVDAINTTLTNSINQEISDRQTAVTGEASARSAADNTLTNSITSEMSRAQGAEATLTSSVSSEASRAQGAESTLTAALNTEVSNRQSAVTNETNARTSADNTLTASISSEASRAQAAESTLTSNLTSESNARTSADNTITASLNSEVARALAAEGTLTTNLNGEITNRQNAVSSEASTRATADATLTTNLNAEATARAAAVSAEATTRAAAVSAEATARANAVTAEANTRSAADNTLTSSINSEVTRATTEENSLQTQINGLSMPQDLSTTADPTFDGLTISASPIYNYGYLGQFNQSFFMSDLSVYANIIMGGHIDMGFNQINDVADPTSAQDAANKNYVDVIADGINSELSDHSTSITDIENAIAALNPISKDYSNAASGTYSAHSASITGNTSNTVNLIGYNASASGSDDQNTGVKSSAAGVSSATTIGGDFSASNNSGSGYAIAGRFSASGAAKNIAVQAISGSIQVQTAGEGIILKSPNGTCYKLTVDNTGTLTTTAITCP